MKIHPFLNRDSPSNINLSLGCKRLRPLAPKLADQRPTSNFDLKSFIKTDTSPRNSAHAISSSDLFQTRQPPSSPPPHHHHHQVVVVETSSTTTNTTSCTTSRWNPTQEQIGILEMLYRGGMRTPNAQQIEQITVELGKYGKIEGKNVFYWFQNHKARERQKQKRNTCTLTPPPPPPLPAAAAAIKYSTARLSEIGGDNSPYKMRKCSSWVQFHHDHDHDEKKDDQIYNNNNNIDRAGRTTLDLFPLHPEGRSDR